MERPGGRWGRVWLGLGGAGCSHTCFGGEKRTSGFPERRPSEKESCPKSEAGCTICLLGGVGASSTTQSTALAPARSRLLARASCNNHLHPAVSNRNPFFPLVYSECCRAFPPQVGLGAFPHQLCFAVPLKSRHRLPLGECGAAGCRICWQD